MPYRKLALVEVAAYLHLPAAAVEVLVRRGEIPFERQGGRLAFRKNEIEVWASRRILGLSATNLAEYHRATSVKAHDLSQRHTIIAELIQPTFIAARFNARTRPSALREMVALAERTGMLCAADTLLRSLQEREELCSTAMPGGFALLHPREHDPYLCEDSFIALGRCTQRLPFGAADGGMTDLFFLVCCQDDRIHLHVIARLCMMCVRTSLLADLREADDASAMHAALVTAENTVVGMV